MPKASPEQVAFNAGEFSDRAEARVDLDKYSKGCKTLLNFIPLIQGGAIKRSGTRYVSEVKDSTKPVRLIEFNRSVVASFILEFGEQYVRFYRNNVRLETGGVPKEVVTPYLAADLYEIQFAQSADVMYLTHPNYPPYKLSRIADEDFAMEQVVFDWPPLLDQNIDVAKVLTPSGVTGAITITANFNIFDPGHVLGFFELAELPESEHDEWQTNKAVSAGNTRIYEGNVYQAQNSATTGTRPPVHLNGVESDGAVNWLYLHSGEGYVQITAYTSPTQVSANVISRLPTSTTSGTDRWSEGAWSDFQSYPRSIAFHETRLFFGGTAGAPNTLWGSVTNSFEDFKTGDEDDESLRFTINTDQVNTIQWLSPDKVLAIGTEGAEFVAHGNTIEEAITPSSVRIIRQTTYGSKHLKPERSGASILFIQRAGRRIREYLYNFDIDRYIATDLSILAEHVTLNGIKDSCHQKEPNRVIWYVTEPGELVALTYEREQDVVGFHRHQIGGNAIVTSLATIPHPDADVDQVWMTVTRDINGVSKTYVEYLDKDFLILGDVLNSVFLDSAIITEGVGLTTITGLDHLEGLTVSSLIDGATSAPDQVVTGGQITLPRPGNKVITGLSYSARLETLRINAGSGDGTAQGKTKRIHNIVVRLADTGPGLFVGPTADMLDEVFFRNDEVPMGSAVPLFTGDKGPTLFPTGYEKPGRIVVEHRSPLPCTILALMPQLHTQDR